MDEDWILYVMEVDLPDDGVHPAMTMVGQVPVYLPPPVQWCIAYQGNEVCQGALKTVDNAKKVAMRCLAAIIDADVEWIGSLGPRFPPMSGGSGGH